MSRSTIGVSKSDVLIACYKTKPASTYALMTSVIDTAIFTVPTYGKLNPTPYFFVMYYSITEGLIVTFINVIQAHYVLISLIVIKRHS